jgi:hypothetical protein
MRAPKLYSGKARVTAYVSLDAYYALEAERDKSKESQSGIVSSILECFLTEMDVIKNEGIQST